MVLCGSGVGGRRRGRRIRAGRAGRSGGTASREVLLLWVASGCGCRSRGCDAKAAAALETEKDFHKVIGFRDLWMLKAALDDCQTADENANSFVDEERLAA